MKFPAILPMRDYRDPALVAEERQAASCHGCAHVMRLTWEAESFEHCGKGRKFGRRCGMYVEGRKWLK